LDSRKGRLASVLVNTHFGSTGLKVWILVFLIPIGASAQARADKSAVRLYILRESPAESAVVKLPVLEGTDIRFARISVSQGLSQVRVSDVVQDDQGFIWFGTWNGLNRYDGYKFKVYKHDPENPQSLSGVLVSCLFKDRSGTIWIGTDQFLDRFEPLTEKFTHYHFDYPDSSGLTVTVNQINQDSSGMLWISTRKGLFRLDPVSGETKRYFHDTNDPSSLGDNDIKSTGEDRTGTFWVGTSQTLDEFDRVTGKVKRHVLTGESGVGLWFHEDRFGVFWVIYGSFGNIGILDRKTNKLTKFEFDSPALGNLRNPAYALLEDHEGTVWFGTAMLGLLKFDREHRRFISYRNRPGDNDSLADNRVIALFEDRERNIWVGLHEVEPNFFTTKPPLFTKFLRPSENSSGISAGLVSGLFQDRQGVLWVGVNRALERFDRKTGRYSSFQPVAGSEVLSIIEDGPDVLWIGNTDPGLLRYSRKTGELQRYHHDANPTSLCSGVVERLLIDRQNTLWGATWDGLCRFDRSTQRFTAYRPDPKTRGLNYYAIAEDPQGRLWLGSNLGLHRFDPETRRFTIFNHDANDPQTLSDNRVNSVLFDDSGTLWAGTQNGLDRFDLKTRTFAVYKERDGMAGNVVSCILEDQQGLLWMSTNKGISSFDPRSRKFSNYTVGDGLPGPDLTGYGACFKSAEGELFFGGFSGVTAFFPEKVVASAMVADAFVPPIVLTDFRLFGNPLNLGPGSPLKKAINYADTIKLSHSQNIFSIEFSALSYFNASANRYRYRLEGLDQQWNEVGSDQRLATYTTLPAGVYTFDVQGATTRGPWSEPASRLQIVILPAWWATWWFRTIYIASLLLVGLAAYYYRMRQIALVMGARFDERTRMARELHDTFLQTIHGSKLVADNALKKSDDPERMRRAVEQLSVWLGQATQEGRAALNSLRTSTTQQNDLADAFKRATEECRLLGSIEVSFSATGDSRELHPVVRDEIYRVGYEAIRNACKHSRGNRLRVELKYGHDLSLHVKDDGVGIDPTIGDHGAEGHFGLQGMHERVARIGGKLTIASSASSGTEITVVVPGGIVFREPSARPLDKKDPSFEG